ncbi:MAG: signal peptidase I [Chloroflexota bacterium]
MRASSVLDGFGRWLRRLPEIALVVLALFVFATAVALRALPMTGRAVMVVSGPSMEPAIGLGAAVITERVAPSVLAIGDVVSMKVGPDRAVFTHRIVRLVERPDGLWIETKGDANRNPDPSITPASAVIGRVTVSIPRLGYLVAAISSPSGTGTVLGFAGLLLALAMLISPSAGSNRASSPGRSSRGRPQVPEGLKPA